jgi:hypothetical protein
MKIDQGALQAFDAAREIAAADGELTFIAATDGVVWPERVCFGARDEPVDVLFSAFKVTHPQQD